MVQQETGETDLATLIASLEPRLSAERYCFALLPAEAGKTSAQLRLGNGIIALISEDEGTTLILTDTAAQAISGLTVQFRCRKITLTVHSSLEAVGMMASVANALAEAGISCNPVAGYFHDHLFVPERQTDEAMEAIMALSKRSLSRP